MRAFQQGEVARILGMSVSQVKNWTIGRPLRVRPSVKARGKGSRNLYDVEDVYRMGLAKRLVDDGILTAAVARILRSLPDRFFLSYFAIITFRPGSVRFRLIEEREYRKRGFTPVYAEIVKTKGCYVATPRRLVDDIDSTIEERSQIG